MNPRIRIMIVSDHPMLSDGLRMACSRTTDTEIVSEALDIAQAIHDFGTWKPDVVIVDLQLRLARGVIHRLRRLCSHLPILVLTAGSKVAAVTNGGARAVIEVSKTCRSETIVDVAREAVLAERKHSFLNPVVQNHSKE